MLIGDSIKQLWRKHIFRISMICILSIGILFFIKAAFSKEEFYIITDGPFSDALGWQNRLLKLHVKTGERDVISDHPGSSFITIGKELYMCYPGKGISKLTLEGKEEWIYQGEVYCLPEMIYDEGWLYFFLFTGRSGVYARYRIETGETEEFLKEKGKIRFSSRYAPIVVEKGWLYTIASIGEDFGILSYHLETGKQEYCLEPVMDMPPLQEGKKNWLDLSICGDYLILQYWDTTQYKGTLKGLYATKMGEAITEETSWQMISFPDRPWQKEIFPERPAEDPFFRDPSLSRDVFGTPNAAGGYVFHDGFIYYLDKDWVLCSRPLFAKGEEESIRYEGTGIAIDTKGHPPVGMCRLYFGETKFYYQYVSEIYETVDTLKVDNAAPRAKKMGEYIGKLPE